MFAVFASAPPEIVIVGENSIVNEPPLLDGATDIFRGSVGIVLPLPRGITPKALLLTPALLLSLAPPCGMTPNI